MELSSLDARRYASARLVMDVEMSRPDTRFDCVLEQARDIIAYGLPDVTGWWKKQVELL